MLYRIWSLLKEAYHYEKHSTLDSDYLRQVMTLAVVVLFALNLSCNGLGRPVVFVLTGLICLVLLIGGVAACPGRKTKSIWSCSQTRPHRHGPAASGPERERRLPEPVVLPDAGYSFRAVGAAHRPAVLHSLRPRGHLLFCGWVPLPAAPSTAGTMRFSTPQPTGRSVC